MGRVFEGLRASHHRHDYRHHHPDSDPSSRAVAKRLRQHRRALLLGSWGGTLCGGPATSGTTMMATPRRTEAATAEAAQTTVAILRGPRIAGFRFARPTVFRERTVLEITQCLHVTRDYEGWDTARVKALLVELVNQALKNKERYRGVVLLPAHALDANEGGEATTTTRTMIVPTTQQQQSGEVVVEEVEEEFYRKTLGDLVAVGLHAGCLEKLVNRGYLHLLSPGSAADILATLAASRDYGLASTASRKEERFMRKVDEWRAYVEGLRGEGVDPRVETLEGLSMDF
ncbi:hypothetical protein F4778DRAFT_740848 [Xylariomycetidae sp. FL2044]|nr:hypothetical protein F4778DRAFT_740848 [Xylariomycetidae sp. FL2044]